MAKTLLKIVKKTENKKEKKCSNDDSDSEDDECRNKKTSYEIDVSQIFERIEQIFVRPEPKIQTIRMPLWNPFTLQYQFLELR